MSKYSHLSGGAPSNVRSSVSRKSIPRKSKSRSKSKSAMAGERIPTQTSFGKFIDSGRRFDNTITNITVKKNKKPNMSHGCTHIAVLSNNNPTMMPLKSKKTRNSSKGASMKGIVTSKSRSKTRKKSQGRNEDLNGRYGR